MDQSKPNLAEIKCSNGKANINGLRWAYLKRVSGSQESPKIWSIRPFGCTIRQKMAPKSSTRNYRTRVRQFHNEKEACNIQTRKRHTMLMILFCNRLKTCWVSNRLSKVQTQYRSSKTSKSFLKATKKAKLSLFSSMWWLLAVCSQLWNTLHPIRCSIATRSKTDIKRRNFKK